ncbi:MAG: 4-hydroxy-tetrahydrodipicolinate reductase [Bradymonadia bacterium]|jgi:4-hydroxy-tetrahydrodipicolinate reductase
MGQAIDLVVAAAEEATVVARAGRGGLLRADADVVVDFSLPEGAQAALAFAVAHGAAFVSGTTGTDESFTRELTAAAVTIPVLQASNMSLGVAVTRALTRLASAALPAEFQPEIVELHHRHKVDSPSGTAIALARDVEGARTATEVNHGRSGACGPRTPNELGVHGVRGGDVVGEHTVYFFGEGERIEITHRATDRAIFARGAVTTALWLSGQPPGVYTMDDVLGLTRT